MFNTVTPDAMSEGSPRMMIIIFLVLLILWILPNQVKIDILNIIVMSIMILNDIIMLSM